MSGRPREFDHNTVIDAAMEAFWTHGYEATSTQALVECTGLQRGSLYNAFGSKQHLYHQALLRYHEQGIQAQARILDGPGPLKDRLRSLIRWGLAQDLDPAKQRGCMAMAAALERAGKDPEVGRISRTHANWMERTLCHLFTLAQRDGELRGDLSPLPAARAFMAGYYGLRAMGRSVHDKAFLDDATEGVLTILQ